MDDYGRIYLKPGSEIALSLHDDGRDPEIYTIHSVIGEGGSTVCYEATRRRNGCVETGKLKEFYPIDAAGGADPWCSLERLESGQLVPCRGTARRFAEMCDEYIDAYRELRNAISSDPDNEILKNYIQHGDILFGCFDEASGIAKGAIKKVAQFIMPNTEKEPVRKATVYVWTPGEKGKTFQEYLQEVRLNPGARPDHTLHDILTTMTAITDSIRAIHTAGLLHLDIKPSNFLVSYYSNFRINPNRVSIFDINTLYTVGSRLPELMGTEGYIAPELRYRRVSNKTDIYSIGAMLFNAIVLSDEIKDGLYRDEYYANLEQLVRHSAFIRESESNSDVRLVSLLVGILKKCLAVNPEMRYRSCTALMKDFGDAIKRISQYTAGEHTIKGKTDPEIVMQKLLYKYPLYDGIKPGDREINVLVVGAGTYGQKFVDICLQTGQMKDLSLSVRTVSNTPREDAELYLQFRPALAEFVDVSIEDEIVSNVDDSYGKLMFTSLGKDPDTGKPREFTRNENEENAALVAGLLEEAGNAGKHFSYIFIALGNDRMNKSIAQMFAERGVECPVCYVSERTFKPRKADVERKLFPVCVNEEITPDTIDRRLEQMAFNTHLSWNTSLNKDIAKEYSDFTANKYNYASSMAYALSIKYKLYCAGIRTKDEDYETAARRFNDEVLAIHETDFHANRKYVTMIALEHRRWVLNYVTAGWTAPRDRYGMLKYGECVASGKIKDKINRTHLCLVPSTEDMPLCSDRYKENDHALWNEGRIELGLDPLDRMSVELHRHYRAAAEEFRAKQPLNGDDMEHIRQLLQGADEDTMRAFSRFQHCLKNILNGVESYTRQYDFYLGQFRKSIEKLDTAKKDDINMRLDVISRGFNVVIESNLYRDYKLSDVDLVRRIPFILTYRPQPSLAIAFEDGRYQNGRNDAVFANVASATLLSPAKICYLYNYMDDSSVELLLRKLRSVLNYLNTREVRTDISLVVAMRSEKNANVLRRKLDKLAEDSRLESDNRAVFKDYEIISCGDMDDTVKKVVKALDTRNIDLFDGTAGLLETQFSNAIMANALIEKGIGYFELDTRHKKFNECRGCEYLKYIEDDSYIRINDMFALMNATENDFAMPEFADDYETLWRIYTGADIPGQQYRYAVGNWNKLCGMFKGYEERVRKPTAEFELPDFIEPRKSHVTFVAEFTFNKMSYVIDKLIEFGIIEPGSNVRGYTGDTCRVEIICTELIWRRLKGLFAMQYLFIDYYGITVYQVPRTDGKQVRLSCHALKVAKLDMYESSFSNLMYPKQLLEQLEDEGFISNVSIENSEEEKKKMKADPQLRIEPHLLSFAYTSPRMKQLLTNEGQILEVFIYYELLKSGYFDDVACGYEFCWEEGGVKNELDCILVKGFRTVIIECKATHTLTLDYYHKLHSIADHFGIGAVKVLVGNTYKDDEELKAINDMQRIRGKQLNIFTVSSREEIENIGETIKNILENS